MSCFSCANSDPPALASQRPKIYDLEEKVLEFSGLKLNEELFVYDVPIQINGRTHLIHTYRCGDSNTETLVLFHGYAGCSALYYLMLKTLSQKFRVFCIDFVGMGLSSKEVFECKSTDETLDFMLGSVEKWREAVGLEYFSLAGHSFGGYLAGQYTLRYQERIKKLTLLSPVGVTKHAQELTTEEMKKKFGWFKRMFFGLALKIWENKTTPSKFIKGHPRLGRMLVKNYVYKRFGLKAQEAEALRAFLLEMLRQEPGSEEAIHYVLKPPMLAAHYPLEEEIVEKINIPVDCYFGEIDYMDTTGAQRIYNSRAKKDFAYKIVPKAAHQVTMQNPIELANEIVVSALA